MRKTDLALGAAVLCMAAGPTFSQGGSAGWPVKPMRLVMPNAPGTGTDTLGRIVAQYLGEELGQQLVVDNRAGAGGVLGMIIGRNAAPDGYTLIYSSPPALTVAPFVQKQQPFDPMKDFAYIST
ncbi:MAG: tripartite tricarboxylate transporter substrate binding protein, partial [Betaproteobacteria bacterium]|nr:tripartite tricarboxylate transporter substrate binding protein [Betaproteobacteria bacterium]